MKRLILNPLLLLCLASASASAQSQSAQSQSGQSEPAGSQAAGDAPQGLSVLKFGWQRVNNRGDWDAPTYSADRMTEDPRSPPSLDPGNNTRVATPMGNTPTRPRERQLEGNRRSSATRNDQQTVPEPKPSPARGAEEYTYQVRLKNGGEGTVEAVEWEYLFLEKGTDKELARHRFQTFRRASAGKSFTLSATSASPPTKVVSAAGYGRGGKPFAERVLIKCVAYADGSVRWRDAGTEADCAAVRGALASRRK